MFPLASAAMLCGVSNWLGPLPGSPKDLTQSPFLSNFATRELMYPSLIKMLPWVSHVTSVGWRNCPSTGGRGGFTRFQGSAPSSDASFLRPKTIVTRPSGLNLITMSEPLSTAHRLSSLSTRTVCANDHAYRFLPTSRIYLPSGPNSRTCAAVAAYAGPVVFPRLNTKMCPFELTATPEASPKCRSARSYHLQECKVNRASIVAALREAQARQRAASRKRPPAISRLRTPGVIDRRYS